MKKIYTLFIIAPLVLLNCFAQAGDLDNTFDGDGVVSTDFISGEDRGNSIVLQSDGKIVVAGSAYIGSNFNFGVVRYTSTGALDPTFGSSGKVFTSIGSIESFGRSAAIQSDGKIVVAGYSYSGPTNDFALVRYNSDGSLDNTFGIGGIVITDIDSTSLDVGNSVVIQPDGKIVVAGTSNIASEDIAIVRYNSNGSLDTTFGFGGIVTTDLSTNDRGNSVALQSDGKIVVTGATYITSNFDFITLRYNNNGTLDSTFGIGGIVTTNFDNDIGHSVVIQSDGKILVAGESTNGSDFDLAIFRYNSNGSMDNTFGLAGMVITDVDSWDDRVLSLAIQSDGKIVAAGESYNGFSDDFVVARYNNGGTLDTSFGNGGFANTGFLNFYSISRSVAIQPDSKILIGGWNYNPPNYDFAVARLNGDGAIGIENIIINQEISIFPNPFSMQTTLQTDYSLKDARLTVYNSFGQPVVQKANISSQTIILERNNLPNGIYLIRLTQNNKVIASEKLIIKDN